MNAIRAKNKINGVWHHDFLVFTLEIHCDSKRVAHETLVQLVKPILVPSNRVRTRLSQIHRGNAAHFIIAIKCRA